MGELSELTDFLPPPCEDRETLAIARLRARTVLPRTALHPHGRCMGQTPFSVLQALAKVLSSRRTHPQVPPASFSAPSSSTFNSSQTPAVKPSPGWGGGEAAAVGSGRPGVCLGSDQLSQSFCFGFLWAAQMSKGWGFKKNNTHNKKTCGFSCQPGYSSVSYYFCC